ncbi:hypothetical protein [Aliidiomarina soli]|uniref:Uncharacterized protein n=1 Tax=Aliidiomarina soli TaxID=1928574 RepID=A0A432WFJ8_9GAMM|nr:hypothetical protein [Aliidiomarina soli]RUO32572.1 hypothetical protein CWE14_10555 [Aliidiomarina soli]
MVDTKITLLFAASALVLAGCAGGADRSSEQQVLNEEGEVVQICRIEKPTGSHIGRRVCRSPEEMEANREAAEGEIDRQRRGDSYQNW